MEGKNKRHQRKQFVEWVVPRKESWIKNKGHLWHGHTLKSHRTTHAHTDCEQRSDHREQLKVLSFCSSLGDLTQKLVNFTGSRLKKSGNHHKLPPSQGSGHQQGYPCFCHSQPSVEHRESPLSSPHTLFTLLHCLFCTSFTDTPHKNTKLQDLINLQEQLRSLVRKVSHVRGIHQLQCNHTSWILLCLSTGIDVSHYDLVFWKLIILIWKNKYT